MGLSGGVGWVVLEDDPCLNEAGDGGRWRLHGYHESEGLCPVASQDVLPCHLPVYIAGARSPGRLDDDKHGVPILR